MAPSEIVITKLDRTKDVFFQITRQLFPICIDELWQNSELQSIQASLKIFDHLQWKIFIFSMFLL